MQKCRVEAGRDGDRNTGYFHTSAIIRKKFNQIEVLQDSIGNWITKLELVSNKARNFFQGLHKEEHARDTEKDMIQRLFPPLREEQDQKLLKPFTNPEVASALKVMVALKAPSLDGFHTFFFQHYLVLIRGLV